MPPSDEIVPGWPIPDYLAQGAWDDATRRRYRQVLYALQGYLQQSQLAPLGAALAAWPQHLQGQGYQPRTVNMRIAAVNGYLRWCGRHDLVMRHETPPPSATPELTRSEYLRLLRAARHKGDHRLYLLVKLFAVTGLPLQCLPQVTAELVRQGGGMLRLRSGTTPLRIPPCLQGELLAYLQGCGIAAGPVFVTSRGQVLNRTDLCRSMRELCRDAGVDMGKGNPRALRSLYQATQAGIQAQMELLQRQAYDQLLQAEQAATGWDTGA